MHLFLRDDAKLLQKLWSGIMALAAIGKIAHPQEASPSHSGVQIQMRAVNLLEEYSITRTDRVHARFQIVINPEGWQWPPGRLKGRCRNE